MTTLPFSPARELGRSRASERVGALAARDGLFQFHFEHRVHLDLPEHLVPVGSEELAEAPTWQDGVLPERKYQSFRHDLPIGSFHPHHRGKWTAHELCHALVGFAWRPDATPLWHATAGRLAELLPVALWYFLDEAGRLRCPQHRGGGALFRTYCRACDQLAGRREPDAELLERGRAFVEDELVAIQRTRTSGVPHAHRWATLDLTSDGIAYARAHGLRLASPGFASYVERFAVADGGWVSSLDELEARVLAVTDALLGGDDPAPLAPSAAHGRARWMLQDLAWRVETVRCQCEGEVADELDGVLDRLAAAIPSTTDPARDAAAEASAALADAFARYVELDDEWELLPPAELVAVGYDLGLGAGSDEGAVLQLADGLRTCTPGSFTLAGTRAGELVAAMMDRDRENPTRDHLADRWAGALESTLGPADAAAQLARYEAALAVVPRRVQPPLPGPGRGRWRLVDGVRLEDFTLDVAGLAEAVQSGTLPAGPALPRTLAIGRAHDGSALVAELEPGVAGMLRSLQDGAELPDLGPEEIATLQELGLIEPVAWVI